MKLADIAKRSKRLSLDIEVEPGKIEKLRFDYRPSAYTADLLKQMSTEVEGESQKDQIDRNLDQQPKILDQLVSWWDMTEEDGKTYIDPNEAVFAALDIPLRAAMLTKISQDINPDPQSPANSNAGSFTTVQ